SPVDNASFSYEASAYCANVTDPLPTITGVTGGTFSAGSGLALNSSTGAVDLSASTAGSYTVNYLTGGLCPNTGTFSLAVNPSENAAFGYGSASYCANVADPTPIVTGTTGGTFSAPAGLSLNSSTGQVDLSSSSLGAYSVAYITPGSCPDTSAVSLTVVSLDDASFSFSQPIYCINGTDPSPSSVSTPGGTFSSSSGLTVNVSTGEIDLSSGTPGPQTVTYQTDGSCPNSSTVSFSLSPVDNASFSYEASAYCANVTDPLPTITGVTGGSFSAGSGLAVNPSTGAVDLSASTAGSYTVNYLTGGLCPNTGTFSLTVNPSENAAFGYGSASYCANATDPSPTVSGTTGGTFSAPAGLSLNSSTGQVDLSSSILGVYSVSYITPGGCSDTSIVSLTVTSLDDAGFSFSQSSYCANSANPLPSSVSTPGGTFSSASGLAVNVTTGEVDLSSGTPGPQTVTYQTAGSCPNSSTVSFSISTVDNASFSYGAPAFCANVTDPMPTITGLAGGTFSAGSGLAINSSTGAVDLSASTVGSYTVNYLTGGLCPNTGTFGLTVNASDNAAFGYGSASYCANVADPSPIVSGTAGGSFSSPAGLSLNSSTGQIDLSASTLGAYSVSYITPGSCPDTSSVSITVALPDDARFSFSQSVYCVNGADPSPSSVSAPGGTFSSASGLTVNASTGEVDLSSGTPGPHTVTYLTAGSCPNSSTVSLSLTLADIASFSYGAPAFCSNVTDPKPTITGLAGGTFSAGSGLVINSSTGIVDLSASTAGSYTVNYLTGGICPNTGTFGLTVNASDNAAFGYGSASYCANVADPSPTVSGTAGGSFSSPAGLSLNSSTGQVDLSSSTLGAYSVTYITPGSCPDTSSVSLTVASPDDAGFSFSQTVYCVNGADPTPSSVSSPGGTFSSASGLTVNASTGEIDLSSGTPGAHSISYLTAGSCPNSSTVNFSLFLADNASFSYPQASYCLNSSDPLPQVSGLVGGSYSSTSGLSLNASTGVVDLSASTAGTYTVNYLTRGTCPNTDNFSMTILPEDDASFNYSQTAYCLNGSNPVPAVTGLSGGVFSSAQGLAINASTGEVPLLAYSPGTYTVNYRTSGPCPSQSGFNLTLAPPDDARFSYPSLFYCTRETDPLPQIQGVPGGTFTASSGLSIDANTGRVDLSASSDGSYTVRYTTASSCPETHEETLMIGDLLPPVASARNVILSLNGQGRAVLPIDDVDNQSVDNCGIAQLSLNQTEFDCSHVGENTVSLTAYDYNGNSHSVQAQVTVRDDDPPVISPLPVSVFLDNNGVATIDASALSISDNCGQFSATIGGNTLYTCAEAGLSQFNVVTEDAYGNSASELLPLSVLDTLAPGIICPPDIRQVVLASETPMQLAIPQAVMTDNCPAGLWLSNSFNQTSDASGAYPLGVTSVRWTAGDASGNRSYCEMRVELLVREQGSLLQMTSMMQMEEHQTVVFQSQLGELLTGEIHYQQSPESQNLGATLSEDGRMEWPLGETHGGAIYNMEIQAFSDDGQEMIGREMVIVSVQEVNEPHVIEPVSEQVVGENEELNFQINVSDTDVPENIFIYRLDPAHEHLGIFVHSATGEVLWTPGEEHGGNTYSVRIWVTDNSAEEIRRSVEVPIRVEERASDVQVRVSGGEELTVPEGSSVGQLEFELFDPERRHVVPGITIITNPSGVIDEQNFSIDQSVSPHRLSYNVLDQEYVGFVEVRLLVDDRLSTRNRVHELRYLIFFEREKLPLNVPNMITPNGDGVNDTWNILNLSVYSENTVQVFDPHGNRVFYRENYSKQSEWDGTYEGRELPSATYFYIIEADNRVFRGVLKIVR
ncbi:MAG: gliding motility-associated C-terminal domain-containing protein, partial [Cytophagales bacterium]|nr:gliding motility-associated C-terminal domain-containing protein [Cytophagales bacterium]